MHNITDSTENYLEAIYVMSKKAGSVRSVDIARFLDVTKPSVSVAMRKLREAKYIRMARDGMITLLPEGLKIAKRTYERHVLLRTFLIHLGVDEETADKDACKIEHALSRDSFEALQRHAQEIDLKTPEK
ncbi:MAG: metal-dependent transcriptional regulator [Clostridiaceae bacterium]|jgi:Mn-dependent DtxR family transcriptional regulator|nr:metal-dependent transcriptional regulator [Clostridiaceae bacterium]